MRINRWTIAAFVLLAASSTAGDAQLGGLRKKAEEAAAKRAAAEAQKKSADSLKKAATKDSSAKQGAAKSSDPASPPVTGAAPTSPASGSAQSGDPKVWENYDFVPGSRVIFYTDFTEDKVGNFARRLKYRSGPVEIVERDGQKVLRAVGPAEFLISVGTTLPEKFTLEFDLIAPPTAQMARTIQFEGGFRSTVGPQSAKVIWSPPGTWIESGDRNMGNSTVRMPAGMEVSGVVAHIRVLMDGAYFKMYTNERRMYNIPELAFKRDTVIRVAVEGAEADGKALYLTSIRVAESTVDVLYDALATKGRWATQGILFATGKAALQPESRPVLKEIATTLREHADLRILIEGHTDNVGASASNLTLSDARAAAVKAALVVDFGIAAERISTKGFGDTKPSVPNATAEGRAQNRRVEVVKQ
jgi:OmpA-OmpF porin, OOP family